MRYHVVRHHEMDVDATDEEDARRKGVGWEPYQVSVTPLDLEALAKYRAELVDRRMRLKAKIRALDDEINEVDAERVRLYAEGANP